MTDCDVVICGLGPVGQLLALLLGDMGVRTIAADEAFESYDLPRAAVIDDEVLRIFQAVGLDERILADAQIQKAITYVTNRGRSIKVFRPEHGDLGHPPLVSIHQPSMERTMVAALEQRGAVELLWGQRVEVVDRAADHVTAWLRPMIGGRAVPLRARYVVGCDGARSAVRGGLQVAFGGSTFAQHWLVLDALVDRPLAKVTHPHFVGDTKRPVVTLPMSPGRHRWEFMVHPGEDPTPLLDPARLRELIAPWLAGEQVEVERALVYTFHSRTATRWRVGRVLLAGDAAHVMPPFVGQGFSSGARDASNLAWKLDAVLRGAPTALLDSYETERRPHVRSMQRFAMRWGGIVQTPDPRVGWIRDAAIQLLDRSGSIRRSQHHIKPAPRYPAGAFAQVPGRPGLGRAVSSLFPQPDQLDDWLGRGWAVLCTSGAAADAWRAAGLHVIERHADGWLTAHDADWAVLRPDRFVFACGRAAQLPPALHALRSRIGPGLRSERPLHAVRTRVMASPPNPAGADDVRVAGGRA